MSIARQIKIHNEFTNRNLLFHSYSTNDISLQESVSSYSEHPQKRHVQPPQPITRMHFKQKPIIIGQGTLEPTTSRFLEIQRLGRVVTAGPIHQQSSTYNFLDFEAAKPLKAPSKPDVIKEIATRRCQSTLESHPNKAYQTYFVSDRS